LLTGIPIVVSALQFHPACCASSKNGSHLRAPALCLRQNRDIPGHGSYFKFRMTAAKPVPEPRPCSTPIFASRTRWKLTPKRADRIAGFFAARLNGCLRAAGPGLEKIAP
jgi:hypothetical protein